MRRPDALRSLPSWWPVAGLVAASTVVWGWAAQRVKVPWIAADEMIYAELGRSFWETGHLSILGADTPFYSFLHPVLIGLPLALADGADGYDAARILQALVMSLAAVPVYLWGRALVSSGWAALAAALTLAVPGLGYSALLMSEVVFYPVMTVAAWAMARALLRPTRAAHVFVVVAVGLALLTRIQAVVLLPVFVAAVALMALLERSARPFRRTLPALGGLAALGACWAFWQLAASGGVLGAYQAAGRTRYDLADALRFVVYHAGDAVLLTGLVPIAAVTLLAVEALRSREPSEAVRAYLAVTIAFVAGLVTEVGIFASRYVGRLAERDLLPIAPLCFLGLAVWMQRGATRPRLTASLVALAVAVPALLLPLGRLVFPAALPDAFMLVPVWQLRDAVDPDVLVFGGVGVAAVAFALLPRRALVALPIALLALLLSCSVAAARYVAREAERARPNVVGSDARWIDRAADGPVAYVYDGDQYWNAVWEQIFWNRRIRFVYRFAWVRRRVPGPVEQEVVRPRPDGLLTASEAPAPAYLAAPTGFTFFGEPVARNRGIGAQDGLVLWRLNGPARMSTMTAGIHRGGDIYDRATLVAYDCDFGALAMTLIAKGAPVTVAFRVNGREVNRVALRPLEIWRGRVPAGPAARPGGRCRFAVEPTTIIGSTRFEFVRS